VSSNWQADQDDIFKEVMIIIFNFRCFGKNRCIMVRCIMVSFAENL